jgi:hypothetical protein
MLALSLGLALIAVAAGVVAWQKWPPLLRYRQHRIEARMQAVVGDYLHGAKTFERSAEELAGLLKQAGELRYRVAAPSSGASVARFETIASIPAWAPRADPRIDSLHQRAMILAAPPQVRARLEEMYHEGQARKRPPN